MPRNKGYKSNVPNADAAGRIRRLAAYREQHMKERGKVPVWTAACNFVGIRQGTVIRHAPELAEYRELHRDEWGRPPAWSSACKNLHINYRTLRYHAPELFEKWKDPDFHW